MWLFNPSEEVSLDEKTLPDHLAFSSQKDRRKQRDIRLFCLGMTTTTLFFLLLFLFFEAANSFCSHNKNNFFNPIATKNKSLFYASCSTNYTTSKYTRTNASTGKKPSSEKTSCETNTRKNGYSRCFSNANQNARSDTNKRFDTAAFSRPNGRGNDWCFSNRSLFYRNAIKSDMDFTLQYDAMFGRRETELGFKKE